MHFTFTLEELKKVPAGEIIRVVTTGFHKRTIDNEDESLTFVAKKGHGHDDWAIYYGRDGRSVADICAHGDKLTSEPRIRYILPCEDEVLSHYRF